MAEHTSSGGLHHALGWVRQHPYATAGIVFAAGAVLIYLHYAGGSGTPAAAGDPNAAYLQAQLQSEAIQAQYGAQIQAGQIAAGAAANQVGGAVQLGSIAAGVQGQSIAAQQTLGLASIGAQQTLGLASIGAQQTIAALQIGYQQDQTDQTAGLLRDQADQQYQFLQQQASLAARAQTQQYISNIANNAPGGSPAATASAADYVTSIYNQVLGRTPEATGLSFWVDRIRSGVDTPANVFAEIQNSPEHQAQLASGVPIA